MARYEVTDTTHRMLGKDVTRYAVTRIDHGPKPYDKSYSERSIAEAHVAMVNAIPEGYSIERSTYPARSGRTGYVWRLRTHTEDPRPLRGDYDEAEYGLGRIVELVTRLVRDHAAGAPERIAKAEAERERASAAEARRNELIARKGELATPRQISYILRLLSEREYSGEGGGFFMGPTDPDQVAELSKREASNYIDSLTGRY